jgi:hypothetical protein
MKTTEFNTTPSSHQLNENLYKKFGVKVNFEKYNREQLEDARNKIRTEIHQLEAKSNFNDLLSNESYQKNKQLVSLLNTRIKEMLGESIAVMERKLSGAEKKKKEEVVKAIKRDNPEKRTGKGKSSAYAIATAQAKKIAESDKGDMDHDGKDEDDTSEWKQNRNTAIKKATGKEKKVSEKFDPLKHVKNPTAGEKAAAKDVKRGSYADRAAMLKSAEADGRLKDGKVKEGFPTVADAKARAEKEQGTGKFDKKPNKETGGTIYTRKSSTFTNGTEDKPKDKKVKEGSKNLPGNQEKIDADKDGKIEKSDFAKLRAGKKKMKESQHKQNVKLVNESIRRLINEDEEGKAKSITAGTDMVNDFTSWMTRVGQYQTKSMIELADAIRANFGQEQAETFKQAVAPALETALNTLTQAREQLSNAVAVLAGESAPMDAMGGEPGMDGMDGMAEPGMDSMNAGNEEVPMDDEFGAADAAAGGAEMSGREMRESRKLFAAKLNEAHSIIARLSK